MAPKPKRGVRRPAAKPAARPAAPLPASNWTPMDGTPRQPQDFQPAQQFLMDNGYEVGERGADGKWGPSSQAGMNQFTDQLNKPLPARDLTNATTTTTTGGQTPLTNWRPKRGQFAAPKVGPVVSGNPTQDAITNGIPQPKFGQQMQAAAQLAPAKTTVTPVAAATAPPATLPMPAAPTVAAKTPVLTGSEKLKQLTQKAGTTAAGVGNAIKENPMAALNAGLGVAGLIMNATAKTPEVPAYQDFNPALRGARGIDPAKKALALESITSSARQASQATGPDMNLNTAARLAAGRQASAQATQLQMEDQQVLRQDQDRLDAQRLQVDSQNSQNREARKMATFDFINRRAEAQKAQGAGMAQGALTYFAQQEAAGRQAQQQQISQENEQYRSMYETLKTQIAVETDPAKRAQLEARLEQLPKAQVRPGRVSVTQSTTTVQGKRHGGKVPVFRRGGRTSRQTESTTVSSGRSGKEPMSAAMQEFQRQMGAITRQAMSAIQQTAMKLIETRTRPLPR